MTRTACKLAYPYLGYALIAVLITYPLWPAAILNTQSADLANHVRHIEEYRLAIREGQLLPLVAPAINGGSRVPLFQYYSGTAYVLPGLLCCLVHNPFLCMKIAVVLQSLLAALAVQALCRLLGCDRFPSFVAAVAFQVFPFAGVDLYNRGAYPEWAALEWLPVLFYLSLRLGRATSPRGAVAGTLLLALAWAYFVPLHPLQSLYGGGLIAALSFAHVGIAMRDRTALRNLAAAYLTGTLLSSWFWLPVLLDFRRVQNFSHQTFGDGFVFWDYLLWPFFRESTILHGWAPQVGLHFVVAAVATLFYRPSARRVPWVAAVLFLFLLTVILVLRKVELLQVLCGPLQACYRLLIPSAVLGAVCLGWLLTFIKDIVPWRHGPASVGAACLTLLSVTSAPYYLPAYVGFTGRANATPVAAVLSPAFRAPNSSQYTFFGTDLRTLGWVSAEKLVVNRERLIPWEGLPFEFLLDLEADGDLSPLRFLIDGRAECAALQRVAGRHWRLRGLVVPARGIYRQPQLARFDLPAGLAAPRVRDFRVRPVGYREAWFRQPESYTETVAGRGQRFRVYVDPIKAGLYQLPIHYFPGLRVRVNGRPAVQASADANLLVVPLVKGWNEIDVKTRVNPVALALMAATVCCWGALLGRLGLQVLRRRRVGTVAAASACPPQAA